MNFFSNKSFLIHYLPFSDIFIFNVICSFCRLTYTKCNFQKIKLKNINFINLLIVENLLTCLHNLNDFWVTLNNNRCHLLICPSHFREHKSHKHALQNLTRYGLQWFCDSNFLTVNMYGIKSYCSV